VKVWTITVAENECMKGLIQPKLWAQNIEIPSIPITFPAELEINGSKMRRVHDIYCNPKFGHKAYKTTYTHITLLTQAI
jgi:hypothetical protein